MQVPYCLNNLKTLTVKSLSVEDYCSEPGQLLLFYTKNYVFKKYCCVL